VETDNAMSQSPGIQPLGAANWWKNFGKALGQDGQRLNGVLCKQEEEGPMKAAPPAHRASPATSDSLS